MILRRALVAGSPGRAVFADQATRRTTSGRTAGDPIGLAVDMHDAEAGELAGSLFICPLGELEQLYPTRSARAHDRVKVDLRAAFGIGGAPRALALQQDLAHHYGVWHRTPIPDLLIAETAPRPGA